MGDLDNSVGFIGGTSFDIPWFGYGGFGYGHDVDRNVLGFFETVSSQQYDWADCFRLARQGLVGDFENGTFSTIICSAARKGGRDVDPLGCSREGSNLSKVD